VLGIGHADEQGSGHRQIINMDDPKGIWIDGLAVSKVAGNMNRRARLISFFADHNRLHDRFCRKHAC
jgi:hypothetical protein